MAQDIGVNGRIKHPIHQQGRGQLVLGGILRKLPELSLKGGFRHLRSTSLRQGLKLVAVYASSAPASS